MYWNSLFHKSTSTLSVILGLRLLRLLGKQHELTDTLGNEGPHPAPLASLPLHDSPTPLFPFHLVFKIPIIPCLTVCCTGRSTPSLTTGWGSPGNSLWVLKEIPNFTGGSRRPGCWEELCGTMLPCPLPFTPSLSHLICCVADGGKSASLVGAN